MWLVPMRIDTGHLFCAIKGSRLSTERKGGTLKIEI
jgi:hypothetical protein